MPRTAPTQLVVEVKKNATIVTKLGTMRGTVLRKFLTIADQLNVTDAKKQDILQEIVKMIHKKNVFNVVRRDILRENAQTRKCETVIECIFNLMLSFKSLFSYL